MDVVMLSLLGLQLSKHGKHDYCSITLMYIVFRARVDDGVFSHLKPGHRLSHQSFKNTKTSPLPSPPPPGWGDGDHLCPYGRKLIGSLVPVHSRSVRSNTYAFLDPSLKLVAFLLNYFTCFPIHNMIVLTDVVCYG